MFCLPAVDRENGGKDTKLHRIHFVVRFTISRYRFYTPKRIKGGVPTSTGNFVFCLPAVDRENGGIHNISLPSTLHSGHMAY